MRIAPTRLTIAGLLAGALLAACGNSTNTKSGEEKVVNVYNWADYIAPDTIPKFEAEYGIKVNYDTYDSSEVVDVKMLAGASGYDVVVHSNQLSERLAPIGVFEKLDFSRFKNLHNLDPVIMKRIEYKGVTDYNVPYFYGSTGYAWNYDMVKARLPNHKMDSSDVLFDPAVTSKLADCGVSLLDSPTDLIPMVLAYLGRDPNAVDDENLAAAEAQLDKVRPYIRYFSNQKMMTDLPNKEVCVAMSWSGDYAQAAARAEEAGIDIDLRYTMPKEGSGLWVDGLYIPKDAPHKDNAYLFIDFLMRPDIAAANANYVVYPTLNKAAMPYIRPADLNNPDIYFDEHTWSLLYKTLTIDPKRERPRTRMFARVKSGI